MDQPPGELVRGFLGEFESRDIDAGADIPEEGAVGRKTRRTDVQGPAVFAIPAAHTIFHLERFPGVERIPIDFQAAVEIVAMHALRPSIAQLLLQRAASKVEPAFVEKS